MAPPGKNGGDKAVISVDIEQGLGDQLWWCVWREDIDSLETFVFFDPDDYTEATRQLRWRSSDGERMNDHKL
jgi:hypothetical protein